MMSANRKMKMMPLRARAWSRKTTAIHPKCKCYMDQVDAFSTHNRTFFIYDLGRYNNQNVYHYGETSDLYWKECQLRKTFPYYVKVVEEPVEIPGALVQNLKEALGSNHVWKLDYDEFGIEDAFFTCSNIDLVLTQMKLIESRS
jgi:hypothetical protein